MSMNVKRCTSQCWRMLKRCYAIRHRTALLYNVGLVNWRQGRYAPAYREVSEAYNINQKISGEVAATTANSPSLLALVLQYQENYEAAVEMNQRAVDGREKVRRVEHPDILVGVGGLASVLQAQGKYDTAEEMHPQVLEGREKVPFSLLCNDGTTMHPFSILKLQQGSRRCWARTIPYASMVNEIGGQG